MTPHGPIFKIKFYHITGGIEIHEIAQSMCEVIHYFVFNGTPACQMVCPVPHVYSLNCFYQIMHPYIESQQPVQSGPWIKERIKGKLGSRKIFPRVKVHTIKYLKIAMICSVISFVENNWVTSEIMTSD